MVSYFMATMFAPYMGSEDVIILYGIGAMAILAAGVQQRSVKVFWEALLGIVHPSIRPYGSPLYRASGVFSFESLIEKSRRDVVSWQPRVQSSYEQLENEVRLGERSKVCLSKVGSYAILKWQPASHLWEDSLRRCVLAAGL